ncbi:ATP-binding cassette domain-containing protein [Desulfococcus sp.]|uniref:ATP-binding cassette domain-containing protein n=1 Tax=Desulfococcus sp. TaxID=2025834 RepID=UPI00359426F2
MGISCRNISYRYPGAETFVFRDLSFEMAQPGFNALFGPSGVGKTSFAKILSGDLAGHGGEVTLDGIDRLAYSYNLERLPGWSTVGRHLEKIVPEIRHGRMAELLPAFGIEACLDQRFSQLSLGQKNRVNLIRYLLQDFQLLILDESLANVDELTRERIILKMKDMFPETYFIYISHNVVEVSKFCRDILVFRGLEKQPASTIVRGQDLTRGRAIGTPAFERTMLEIMNAV